jgi:hypothetical protein
VGIKNYQDLMVWQKAMDLVEAVYEVSKRFPKHEVYGLTSQPRRAAVSIPRTLRRDKGGPPIASFTSSHRLPTGRCASSRPRS